MQRTPRHKRAKVRRGRAREKARLAARDELTPGLHLKRLDERLGEDVGATRERAKWWQRRKARRKGVEQS